MSALTPTLSQREREIVQRPLSLWERVGVRGRGRTPK